MSGFVFKQLINGEWVDAANGGVWQLVNPATEEIIAPLPFGDGDDAQAAVDAAAAAFPGWAGKTPYERAVVLKGAADWIRARIDDLGRLTVEESGKPLREATGEWNTSANFFEWYAEEGKRAYGRVIPDRKASRRILVVNQPIGVVGTITAWNFPAYNVSRAWAAALSAGCTVVGRPSEYTPRTAMAMAQALHESGAPPGVINIINGDPAAMGQVMLNDARVRKISFTGSTRVGKLLMDGASRTVTKLALEMGGNAPVLIFPDVDVEEVAKTAVGSKYRNNGQVCIAPQRFYVHSRIAEEFIDHATRFSHGLRMGSGLEPATDVGPLINAIQRERLEQMVTEATHQGAEVLTGGARPAEFPRGYFYEPTVMINLKPEMAVYCEELFGPVMPIIPFADPDEAIALANGLEAGLAAYVQTRDLVTAIHAYEKLDYGMVGINEWMPVTPEAPFGGMKASGIGRESGIEGMHEYLESKAVYIGGL
ncbi:MAG: NAD-dependent succinate-semialdehyde dehydrogenase [Anaerolineae bacterium]|nr:NAD-dependent succinate-semialdehyde dehydrogenase [Anaerolineae bacterium]